MKHQQVSVDFWAMGKALFMYGGLTVMGWIMMRLFNTVFTLPRRMRQQQDNIQNTLLELQRRFPDMDITEEDLKNAEKELEEIIKEDDEKKEKPDSEITGEKEKLVSDDKKVESEAAEEKIKELPNSTPPQIEEKKTI